MKLKKATEGMDVPETLAPIPGMDLAAAPEAAAPSGAAKVMSAIALVCTLASIVMLGLVAWMMYANLELIQDV